MKVKLNPNKIHMNESIDFTLGKEYFVIGISYGLWQVIGNNIARPYSYSPELFIVTDPSKENWVTQPNGESECPEELKERALFDRYFDGYSHEKEVYRQYLIKLGLMNSDQEKIPYPKWMIFHPRRLYALRYARKEILDDDGNPDSMDEEALFSFYYYQRPREKENDLNYLKKLDWESFISEDVPDEEKKRLESWRAALLDLDLDKNTSFPKWIVCRPDRLSVVETAREEILEDGESPDNMDEEALFSFYYQRHPREKKRYRDYLKQLEWESLINEDMPDVERQRLKAWREALLKEDNQDIPQDSLDTKPLLKLNWTAQYKGNQVEVELDNPSKQTIESQIILALPAGLPPEMLENCYTQLASLKQTLTLAPFQKQCLTFTLPSPILAPWIAVCLSYNGYREFSKIDNSQ